MAELSDDARAKIRAGGLKGNAKFVKVKQQLKKDSYERALKAAKVAVLRGFDMKAADIAARLGLSFNTLKLWLWKDRDFISAVEELVSTMRSEMQQGLQFEPLDAASYNEEEAAKRFAMMHDWAVKNGDLRAAMAATAALNKLKGIVADDNPARPSGKVRMVPGPVAKALEERAKRKGDAGASN